MAFFGDLLLHMPDAVLEQLNKNRKFRDLSRWGWTFCNETNIFEKSDKTLLHLMAQELQIIGKPSSTALLKIVPVRTKVANLCLELM